jgi:hypothetical protein
VISQDLVITDDETAPVVTGIAFDVADFSENGAMTVLTLTQSNPAVGETCFDVSFTGTALAGTDFASDDDDPPRPVPRCVSPAARRRVRLR